MPAPLAHHRPPHAWLDARSVRLAADAVLGCLLLGAGLAALIDLRAALRNAPAEMAAATYPVAIVLALLAIGTILMLRTLWRGAIPDQRWRPTQQAIFAACIIAAGLAAARIDAERIIHIGPPELAALCLLALAGATALARLSRVRATGMVLLGLLLAMVGVDLASGTSRMTMGIVELLDGVDPQVAALGLLVVADGVICLFAPSLFLATYRRQLALAPGGPPNRHAALALRALGALSVAAACWRALGVNDTMSDLAACLAFAAFGVACRIFGWNRLLLLAALALGPLLEETAGRTLLLAQDDPAIFADRPMIALVALGALAVALAGAAHSGRRALAAGRADSA
jgi:hypothetical protein